MVLMRKFIITIFSIYLLALPQSSMAQTYYGEGNYNTDVYNGSVQETTPNPTISPTYNPYSTPIITVNTLFGDLPVTGSTMTVSASVGAILMGLGILLWANRYRKKRPART